MKKRIVILSLILVAAAAVYWYVRSSGDGEYSYRTEAVSRGEIEKVVRATGTINPIQTVKVGSQVSGTIAKLFVDFNSVVKEGQIIAVIDSTFLSASVREAEANLQRSSAQLNEAERAMNRAKDLFAKDLVSQADLDAAITTYQTSVAQMKQTEAALERAMVNLRYSVIRSPINGIVVSRDVDVGQTVAASLQAPQLFAIANDLKRMQVEASVDEADIGQIDSGQSATFTVDAYPDEDFEGTVTQVRLSPITQQNVVTYTVIIEVPNPEGKLRPGMTATASILIDRREDVVRVPAVALRFQPPSDVLEEYNKERASDTSSAEGTRAGRPGGLQDMAQATERGGGADSSGRDRGAFRRRMGNGGAREGAGSWNRSADGIAGFEKRQAGTRRANMAVVWVLGNDGKLSRLRIRTGVSDQRYVELVGGNLKEGDKVVLGLNNNEQSSRSSRTSSPLQPQMGGPPPGAGRR